MYDPISQRWQCFVVSDVISRITSASKMANTSVADRTGWNVRPDERSCRTQPGGSLQSLAPIGCLPRTCKGACARYTRATHGYCRYEACDSSVDSTKVPPQRADAPLASTNTIALTHAHVLPLWQLCLHLSILVRVIEHVSWRSRLPRG